MKHLKSGYVFLSVLLTIALSGTFAVAEYHHVEDCSICHYSGGQDGSNCKDCPNDTFVRCVIDTPSSGNKEVVFTGSYVDEDFHDGVCQVCHTQTKYYTNDGSGDPHPEYQPGLGGPGTDCMLCHKHTPSEFGHGGAEWGPGCEACHDHTATPGSGWVTIFADDGHDSAGWIDPKPYFDVDVDCGACHKNDLFAVHGVDSVTFDHCSTCHPTPYNTLDPWDRSCQQGDCHIVYHEGSPEAHEPFEDPFDPENDCNRCHDQYSWAVEQDNCLNCHATYNSVDTTAPVTTTNALPSYVGPANIDFSIYDEDNAGKVGVGITFYKLDSGPETAGTNLFVSALDPYPHVLELWSKDQAGNDETPHFVDFFIDEDFLPPTTTSNAQATYNQGAVITLTATDDGTLGVKNTYFSLNDGPTQTGTSVNIPAASGPSVDYTLDFWSEDWSGNIEEPHNSVDFTVLGNGTLRLVWGNSDEEDPSWLCSVDPEAWADWVIRSGGSSGPVFATGWGDCSPGPWSGVNDVTVPVSPEPYYVKIDWWDSYYEWEDQTVFWNVYVTTPEIIRLSY